MREGNNNLLAGFDADIANPIGQGIKGALQYAGISRAPTGCYSPPTKKCAPRIEVASFENKNTQMPDAIGFRLLTAGIFSAFFHPPLCRPRGPSC